MLPQQRTRNSDAAFYSEMAHNPVLLGISIVWVIFNLYCIYRCIRNEAWLWLILGFCVCGVFWWIGAFGAGGGKGLHGGQRIRKGKTVWHRY